MGTWQKEKGTPPFLQMPFTPISHLTPASALEGGLMAPICRWRSRGLERGELSPGPGSGSSPWCPECPQGCPLICLLGFFLPGALTQLLLGLGGQGRVRGAGPTAALGSTVVVMVMVAPPGRPKQHRADVAFQNIKRGTVGVSGHQEHLRWCGRGTGEAAEPEGG